jgi:hypothetical protein
VQLRQYIYLLIEDLERCNRPQVIEDVLMININQRDSTEKAILSIIGMARPTYMHFRLQFSNQIIQRRQGNKSWTQNLRVE